MPFNYLRSEGFWHLITIQGVEPNLNNTDRNDVFRRIKNQALVARLDEALFQLLQISDSRDEL